MCSVSTLGCKIARLSIYINICLSIYLFLNIFFPLFLSLSLSLSLSLVTQDVHMQLCCSTKPWANSEVPDKSAGEFFHGSGARVPNTPWDDQELRLELQQYARAGKTTSKQQVNKRTRGQRAAMAAPHCTSSAGQQDVQDTDTLTTTESRRMMEVQVASVHYVHWPPRPRVPGTHTISSRHQPTNHNALTDQVIADTDN